MVKAYDDLLGKLLGVAFLLLLFLSLFIWLVTTCLELFMRTDLQEG